MSSRPNPVAETAVMLANRAPTYSAHLTADAASKLHRIAPAFKRLGVAQCNGEWRDGQRQSWYGQPNEREGIAALERTMETEDARLEKKLAKLNVLLEPFAVKACSGGDPRGSCLWLETLDTDRPLPRNGWDDAKWSIE